MSSWPSLALAVCTATVLALPRVAGADPLTAEALFREGRRLLEEGRIDEACAKLAESQAQDPASGTLINLALCYERQGKLATAWATYLAAASSARKDGRADRVLSAEQKGREIEQRVPRLLFRAARPHEGMVVAWGAFHVGRGALESAIPVDPGRYRVEVSAPDRETWAEVVSVGEGELRLVVIPELRPVQAQPPPPMGALRSPAARAPQSREKPRRSSQDSLTLPLIFGASGVASLAVGSYFGLRSLSQYAKAERACPSHRDCDAGAIDAWQGAKTSAWVANIGLPLGAVATVLSGWLFLSRNADRPKVGLGVAPAPDGASVALELEL